MPNELRAALFMLAAVSCFAFLDALAKILVDPASPLDASLPVIQVVWIRFVSHGTILIGLLILWGELGRFKTRYPVSQGFRTILMAGTTFFNFQAIQYLQLDQTVAIFFATPFIVSLLAGPILGEWVGMRRLLAIITGFIGVLIVTSPWDADMHWAIIYSVAATLCLGVFNISTRWLTSKEGVNVTFTYTVVGGFVLLAWPALEAWVWPKDIISWVALLMTGFFGGIGHYFYTCAHSLAPAPNIAPYMYSQLLLMALFGFIFFDDVPTVATLLGSSLIIGSGIYLFNRELKKQKTAPKGDA